MEELLLHLTGDYLLQNDWVANTKTKSSAVAILHSILYTLPFILVTQNAIALSIISVTHFFIDRFRLAVFWAKLVNNGWDTQLGYQSDRPQFLTVWLIILIDNTFHLIINHFSLILPRGL